MDYHLPILLILKLQLCFDKPGRRGNSTEYSENVFHIFSDLINIPNMKMDESVGTIFFQTGYHISANIPLLSIKEQVLSGT